MCLKERKKMLELHYISNEHLIIQLICQFYYYLTFNISVLHCSLLHKTSIISVAQSL